MKVFGPSRYLPDPDVHADLGAACVRGGPQCSAGGRRARVGVPAAWSSRSAAIGSERG